ncbi:MAG: GTPase HflX [Chloroflexota bacterium]|nr:GTPase HflX [Chloroflexota bacterium]
MIEIERSHILIADNFNVENWDMDDRVEEIVNLAESANSEVSGITFQKLKKPVRTYLGSGKLSETKKQIIKDKADLIIIDDELSPNQQRYLEDLFKIKVVDRTALILDIFANRAKSREGRLQVSLAQLEYLLPRLAGQWSHLERLGGGIGTRGPGETQIETDRRLVRTNIKKIKKDLKKIKISRNAQRSRRLKRAFNVSLVGYTNAGKSTLFNSLSKKNSISSGKLFSTLDTKTSKIYLDNGISCTISDTVGFLNKLPTVLVDSFKATLEELNDSDLLLHVIDSSNKNFEKQIEVVDNLLEDLNLEKNNMIYVFNKIDKFTKEELEEFNRRIEYLVSVDEEAIVNISAIQNMNIDILIDKIQNHTKSGYNINSAKVLY